MERRAQDFLNGVPEKPLPSKLQPHYDLIRGLRRKRRTYREIAKILRDSFQVVAAPSTIFAFLKVRSRYTDQQRFEVALPPQFADPNESCTIDSAPHPTQSQLYAHYEALKRRKRTPPPPPPKPAFHYEEGEPLRLISDSTKKDSQRT
jgi:hypothetical protein